MSCCTLCYQAHTFFGSHPDDCPAALAGNFSATSSMSSHDVCIVHDTVMGYKSLCYAYLSGVRLLLHPGIKIINHTYVDMARKQDGNSNQLVFTQ